MSSYRLYYFNTRGRAELCRLAFAAAKLEYEDIRLDSEQWAKEKASGRPPLGQMPFLITPEEKVIGGSVAIMKYICRKAGLSPADNFDEAIADMITDGIGDVFSALVKIHFEKDEDRKKELTIEFFKTTFATKMQKFESLLKDRNEGKAFFLGEKLSYADIVFFSLCNIFANGEPTVPEALKGYPLLIDHYNRVLNVPEIKTWVEKRPKTEH